uniref:UDENN domain-containing protein n=1 Tax=Angiostrongylus cantonensis TaxID=6313 RepID=A0A0K0DEU5_ANGCA
MGWCYEESVPEFLFQSNVCVLDIDTGRMEFPEDLPSFPGAKQLCQEIKSAIYRYSSWEDTSPSTVVGSTPSLKSSPAVVPTRTTSDRRTDEWSAKRMSRSFDRDDAIDEAISKVAEIARRAGVVIDVQNLEQEISCRGQYLDSPDCKQYFQNARLNNAVRECVLNRIVCMLYSYEHFVVGGQGCSDREAYDDSRESLVCFDKASFLSDQPDSHLAFLAAFLETQMFASLIDAKILSQWETPDENLVLFDSRIAMMREKHGLSMVRTPTYESTPPFAHTEELISKREEMLDYVVPGPHELEGAVVMSYNGVWPEQINTALLEGAVGLSPAPSPWKQRYPHLRPKQQDIASIAGRPVSTCGSTGLVGDSPTLVAQQQVKFVDQLLRETKGKTKRMLVDKMGKEAVQLGHFDASITGVEENTLVASFCDLLERIWAHGLIKKQGKSSLWNFVLQHQDLEKTCLSTRTMSSSMLTPVTGGTRRCTIKRAPSLPHCEVPAPVIIQPANENDFTDALSEIVETIQRELGSGDGEGVPVWSRSILRAANFLADKLTNTPKGLQAVPSAAFTPNRRTESQSMLKKSSSVGDFSNPSWNGEVRSNAVVTESPRKRSQSRPRSPETGARVLLAPLPTHDCLNFCTSQFIIRNVLRMTEIKTDIGYARAFVRLALERKLLHKHLATLLENKKLLSELYNPYAFVRCEDEREQFLYHILSLNAAQFRCFTNTFNKTSIDGLSGGDCDWKLERFASTSVGHGGWHSVPKLWKVRWLFGIEMVFCSRLGAAYAAVLKSICRLILHCSSLMWGFSLLSHSLVNVFMQHKVRSKDPKDLRTELILLQHKNLGVLSTLRIGHALGHEKPPKWYLEYVIVRNEVTGQMYRFPCGRWFGLGVEDSRWFGNACDASLERLLLNFLSMPFAFMSTTLQDFWWRNLYVTTVMLISRLVLRQIHLLEELEEVVCHRVVRLLSGSVVHHKVDHTIPHQTVVKAQITEIQQILGEAVNSLVKHFYSEKHTKSELAHLLCGEHGLVNAIEQAFQFGRYSSVWSFRQPSPWDYVGKICFHCVLSTTRCCQRFALECNEKVCNWLMDLLRRRDTKWSREQCELVTHALRLVHRISNRNALGKDAKFHVFILLTVRDHMLSGFLQVMAWTPVTTQLYDELSFLRTPSHLTYLSRLLDSLNEFNFNLDPSLTYGLV